MGGAAFGHLLVVDPGELRVLAAGSISSLDQGGAQQGGPGFAHRLAFAVGLPGLTRARGQRGVGLEPGSVAEAARAAHDRDQDRGADLGEPGQGPGELAGIGLAVVLLAGGGMGREFGLGRAQQPDLGRDLAGQGLERDRGVVAIRSRAAAAAARHTWARSSPC